MPLALDVLQASLDRAYAFARHVTGHPQRAEEAVQEACLRYLRRPPREEEERAAAAYFMRMVHGTAVDMLRGEAARSRREEAHMQSPDRAPVSPEQRLAEEELRLALDEEMAQLAQDERAAVCLCCLEGFSQREAAGILGSPQSTVSDQVQRGLEKLRKAMSGRGFAGLVPAALVGYIGELGVPAAPASLVAKVNGLVAGKMAAGGSAALKGGLLMKIGLGVAAAGLVAGTTLWAAGGGRAEDAASPAPAEKSRFSTPIWSPDAEWELAGDWAGTHVSSSLDGPRREVMWRGNFNNFEYPLLYTPGCGGPYYFCGYDARTERLHALSAGPRGLLDGPLVRARYGGKDYVTNPDAAFSPDRRFYVFTDPGNGGPVRVIDLKEQTIRTALPPGSGAQSMVLNSKGQALVLLKGGKLATVDAATAKPVGEITLKAADGLDLGRGKGLALDEKRNRLYASGTIVKKDGKDWHVWYFDLDDGGSFHGVLAGEKLGPNPGYAGPFDGYKGYAEQSVAFGPDDRDFRFLYMRITDTGTFVRLDLEKRMVAACSGAPRNQKGPVKFIESGTPNGTVSHMGPIWLPGGDFLMPGLREGPAPYFRRVK